MTSSSASPSALESPLPLLKIPLPLDQKSGEFYSVSLTTEQETAARWLASRAGLETSALLSKLLMAAIDANYASQVQAESVDLRDAFQRATLETQVSVLTSLAVI